jgi:acetyl esterase/lipase
VHVKAILNLVAIVTLALGGLVSIRLRAQGGMQFWIVKVCAGALAPFLGAAGALTAVLGLLTRSPITTLLGGASAAIFAKHVRDTTAPHDGFAKAFGPGWQEAIPAERQAQLLERRWNWRLPETSEPRVERDLAFCTLPSSERRLLCDIWQPATGVSPSGLAFIYYHGSGWHVLDKDMGTGPLFRRLTSLGHVVMDVAYRLCPETDVFGMLGDAKRAIAWMKENASTYGVDPSKIVVSGGSAGGHLALLAAYAPNHPRLTPADLADRDLSVRGVVSYYGPSDMRAYYDNLAWWQVPQTSPTSNRPAEATPKPIRTFGEAGKVLGSLGVNGQMGNLLGGSPDEVPEVYDLASPITHVGPHCPPTLLFHGQYDCFVPPAPTPVLRERLAAAGVPAINVEFPRTEHAFDLFFLECSPTGQAALYDLERFLALLASTREGALSASRPAVHERV